MDQHEKVHFYYGMSNKQQCISSKMHQISPWQPIGEMIVVGRNMFHKYVTRVGSLQCQLRSFRSQVSSENMIMIHYMSKTITGYIDVSKHTTKGHS